MFGERGIKEAFDKVKLDIFNLGNEISLIRGEILDIKTEFQALNGQISAIKLDSLVKRSSANYPTDQQISPTYASYPTDNPTVPVEVRGLKYQNFDTSIRNRGDPTDRQTNQQTDQQMNLPSRNSFRESSSLPPTSISYKEEEQSSPVSSLKDSFSKASEILDSLDGLKKEIRLKFKQITQQEMLVFSSIYQLEEKFPEGIEYKQIALKLGLSESSIRDYVQKIISKGIPILKTKLNNKKILLSISSELKKIASLDTLIRLREL